MADDWALDQTFMEGGKTGDLLKSTRISKAEIDRIWSLPGRVRGIEIEKVLAQTEYKGWEHVGAYDNGFNPVIDFRKDSTVVSLKTLDPTIKTFEKSLYEDLSEGLFELANSQWPELGTQVNRIFDVRVPGDTPTHRIQSLKDSLESLIPEGLEGVVQIEIKAF